jgi:anti-anti-sigma regulatory factor
MRQSGSAKIADAFGPHSAPVDDGGERQHIRSVLDDSQAALGRAAELLATVVHESPELWRDTIEGRRLAHRLVELSQAVRKAALVLEQDPARGGQELSAAAHVAPPARGALEVSVARDADGAVVWLRGSITAATSPALALALATLLGEAVSSGVVLDLSSVAAVDADRVWVIGEAARLFRARGTDLSVRNPNPTVCGVLGAAESTRGVVAVFDAESNDHDRNISHAIGPAGALGTWVEVPASGSAEPTDDPADQPEPAGGLCDALVPAVEHDSSNWHASTGP